MPPLIENPADCEVRAVIRFLSAKGSKAAEIHRQISEVYGESVMSEGMVRKWVRAFSNGRTNIHDEERSGRPSVIIDDLIEKVDCRVKENRRFTISSLSKEFPAVSRSVLYEIVTGRLNYRKLCSRWVPKMLTEEHKTKRLASALTFLERYSDEGDDFLSRIVTGDETWVAYVTPESKQQSMEWRHSSSPRKVKFKQTISAQKIMCTVFWDRYGVLLVDFLTGDRGQNEGDSALGLSKYLNLSVNARIMPRVNLWVQGGLVNGSLRTIRYIIYAPNARPPALPLFTLVEFDSYQGPFIYGNPFPIIPITRSSNDGSIL
ncbi:histone-lysine N-methyltransferase SETMAR-like [Centruroides sculpturatus]|uniref:histone-lysine N-methyltransferase SETMAR-like n=1 Tax=Centruroides sculpturatus TaxID=218467 RepID=UPI000C6D0883|nr:histone-lysine N-methyltransferase SETMAR-like [Centruroides sculpturatus]